MGKKPFIRNGHIVFDATEAERIAAVHQRFPGTGRRVGGDDHGFSIVDPDDEVVVVPALPPPYPPPPPYGGGGVIALMPSAFRCLHSSVAVPQYLRSLIWLVFITFAEPDELRAVISQVPYPMARARFHVFSDFLDSDIGARAVTQFDYAISVFVGLGVMETVIHRAYGYRRHPLVVDLTAQAADVMRSRFVFPMAFDLQSGEVMYVITTDYHLLIAGRSGTQRDLPHPTLVGGWDPEVLSAGIVHFRDNRIIRVDVNASGHFRPNAHSSIEVTFALFSALPPPTIHPEFEGFFVYAIRPSGFAFQRGVTLPNAHFPRLPGPVMTGDGGAPSLFEFINRLELRNRLETQALEQSRNLSGLLKLCRLPVERRMRSQIVGLLWQALVQDISSPPFFYLMTAEMRRQYTVIIREINARDNQLTREMRLRGLIFEFNELVDSFLLHFLNIRV